MEKRISEKILKSVAPCSMFCSTCTGCKYGEISLHATELLKLLEGHEEFLDKNLKAQYRDRLDEFRIFQKRLKKFANPKCGGCRNGGSSGCSIKGCIIPECVKEHNIDFCAECPEFPCQKVNNSNFKETTIKKWLDGTQKIKEMGIEKYYEEYKNVPHYINYKNTKGD